MKPDSPLQLALLTVVQAADEAREAVQGARGLTPEGEADLVQRVADAAGAVTRDNGRIVARELRTRTILGTAGAIVAALVLIGVSAYYAGWSAGRANMQAASDGVLQVASQAGPDATAAWLTLMRSNDPALALAACQGTAGKVIDGRRACAVPLWLEPPPAPRVGSPPVAGR